MAPYQGFIAFNVPLILLCDLFALQFCLF